VVDKQSPVPSPPKLKARKNQQINLSHTHQKQKSIDKTKMLRLSFF
jgi:hypothetical protein